MTLLAWQQGGRPGGHPVVLLHDWGSDVTADYERTGWVAALELSGLAVYAADLPGHGESADLLIPPDAEPARWTAAAVLTDLDRLGVDRFAVVGNARGSVVAGQVAVRALERVTHLVLIGCDDRTEVPHAVELSRALGDPGATVWQPEVAEEVARVRRDRRHHLPTLADWVERAAWPAAPNLGALQAPVLLAVGADDERRARAPRLAKLFHDARLMTVPGAGREAQSSGEMMDAVAAFLAGR